jgi:hypothetical protein
MVNPGNKKPFHLTCAFQAGLPDGLVSNKKSQFGQILEGPWNGKCWIFYDHMNYFMLIWYYLWPFGIVRGPLVYFSQFRMFGQRKIWQP